MVSDRLIKLSTNNVPYVSVVREYKIMGHLLFEDCRFDFIPLKRYDSSSQANSIF